ncbi:MAG: hypothetical protein EWM47_10225 [Anaerolineaceae bacterium]|nr:MAG: hypothetical protein EWM47_10225 [Anaerolineaceae bacterium]
MKKHYEKILFDTDQRILRSLDIQILDPNAGLHYGGFRDCKGLVEPKFAIYRTTTMIAGLFNENSHYYENVTIYERVLLGLKYISHSQRDNGFFDLINCNFYSSPDTAFCLKRLIPIYQYLTVTFLETDGKDNLRDYAATISSIIKDILYRGATAMITGGFHTPNHRWAIASVLLTCSQLFNEASFADHAMLYLNEGIDSSEDGEYAERSAGNYNRICNDAMIMIASATGDDSYLEYATRNLYMMLNYIEPDGSIFTNNSTRQDRGEKVYPKDYYMEYLYLGYLLNNETFLQAANKIMDYVTMHNLTAMDCLIHFMNLPQLITFEYESSNMPDSYHKYFRESSLVRIRNGEYSCSIVNQSSSFLYFTHGDLTMGMKIGGSFCEHRAFIPEQLVQKPDCYELTQTMIGWYYLPFGKDVGTSDWWKMDHSQREKIYGPNLNFNVSIKEVKDGFDVHIKVDGIDRAPLRIELSFDEGTIISSDSFTIYGNGGGSLIAKEGTITASKGRYAISAGTAFGNHNFSDGKFGSESKNPNCFTVYFTDYTCFEHVIELRALPSNMDYR